MADQGKKRHSFVSLIRIHHLLGGLCGGVTATLITHPFDLIKLRLAVHSGSKVEQRPRYFGFYHGLKEVFKEAGTLGLYRGASANVAGAGMSWGLYFFLYNAFKFHIQGRDSSKPLHPVSSFLSASVAGTMTLTVTNPIWVVKTRLCLANTASVPEHMRYSGLRDGLAKLYYHEGVKGLYKGYIPGLFGTSHGAIQFMLYEEFKKKYADYKSISIDTKLGPFVYLSMAATSKLSAVCLTYPYQVVRARLQDQDIRYKGMNDVIRKLFKFEGIPGFYKGITANLLKVVPATCITFVVYENVSFLVHQISH